MTPEFNKKFYTVYNVITVTELSNKEIYPINEIYELYSMLIGSKHVVTVEEHRSDDQLRSELRVIFWNEAAYHSWATDHRKRYDELVNSFNKTNSTGVVKFERYTSLDDYQSEFPYILYPDASELIDWLLIPYHKEYMIKNIIPIGKIQDYVGGGKFEDPPTVRGQGSRFIKERTSSIIRRQLSSKSTDDKNFPRLLAYSFDQALLTSMYSAPWLYRRLTSLNQNAENLASQYITDCDNAAVLIGHKSLGNELTLHTHRLSDETRYSFTITIRLTFSQLGAKLKFYEPLNSDDPNINQYYANPLMLYDHVKDQTPNEVLIESRTSVLVFSASYIPHTVEYDNDLYLFYVYDNVTFKEDALESIKSKSEITYFDSYPEEKRLYFLNL